MCKTLDKCQIYVEHFVFLGSYLGILSLSRVYGSHSIYLCRINKWRIFSILISIKKFNFQNLALNI